MRSVVVYTTRHGNTQMLAEAIARALRAEGDVRIFSAEESPAEALPGADLTLIGGPTEQHGLTPPLARYLESAAPGLNGRSVAVFDTRLRGPQWLWGSAAAKAAERLRAEGAHFVMPPESFFVHGGMRKGSVPELEPGELERAARWAVAVAAAMPLPV